MTPATPTTAGAPDAPIGAPAPAPAPAVGPERLAWAREFCGLAAALSPATVEAFAQHYHPQAVFSDPFQTVVGRPAIAKAYQSMFGALTAPRFTDLEVAWTNTETLAIRWVFRFSVSARAPETALPGTSWLQLDPSQGLICRHEDHWDASALFGAFPGIGAVVRWLKSRVAHAGSVTQTD
ncbi:MAG: nuclear transport factor 2 family protein [Burkholderiaceae bacterium]